MKPHNFSQHNLRGRSFRGQDLSGADFSGADIRGADFTQATLRHANFKGAIAGLSWSWLLTAIGLSLLVAGFSGWASGKSGIIASSAISPDFIRNYTIIPTLVISAIVVLFFIGVLRYGIAPSLFVLAWTIALIWGLTWLFRGFLNNPETSVAAWTFAFVLGMGWAWFIAWCGILAIALAGEVWGTVWFSTGIVTWTLAGLVGNSFDRAGTWIISGCIALLLAYVGGQVARRALGGDERYSFVLSTMIGASVFGGTSFKGADLTDADFTGATLSNSDFVHTTLVRTCFEHCRKLDQVRPGTTYLQYPAIRHLIVTHNGAHQNFDRLNLEGIYLKHANLEHASFVLTHLEHANLEAANLSHATLWWADIEDASLTGAEMPHASLIGTQLNRTQLQSVNLSGAQLYQTQLDYADLTGATLTGAYIEDWGITAETVLDKVICEYVFMRLPPDKKPDFLEPLDQKRRDPNPHRKPDNWEETFGEGDFADFIRPLRDTLDLYHNQGVDPRAIAISFQKLQTDHPEAGLDIVAMEKRGEDKFLLRAKTASVSDKSALSARYFETYNQIRSLPDEHVRVLLAESYVRSRDLERTVETLLLRPHIHIDRADAVNHDASSINISSSSDVNIAQGNNNIQGDDNIQGDNNR